MKIKHLVELRSTSTAALPAPNCLVGRTFIAGDKSGIILGVLDGGWYLAQLFDEEGKFGVQCLYQFADMTTWYYGDGA
jgi:hypothetical protein